MKGFIVIFKKITISKELGDLILFKNMGEEKIFWYG